MTVPATTRKAGPYTGTGLVSNYPFSFKILATTDVQLIQADTSGVETTLSSGFSVAMNADQNASPGGSITLSSPLTLNYKLSILGGLPYDQTLSLPGGGNFDPNVIGNTFDRIVMQLQQIQERDSRSVVSAATSSASSNTLPGPTALALLGWDAGGTKLQNYSGAPSSPVSVAMAPVVAAATLGAGRTALGSGAIGDALFLTATAAAARALTYSTRVDVASVTGTVDLSGVTSDDIRLTGALVIAGFTIAAGRVMRVTAGGAFTLTNGAGITTQTGADIVAVANATFSLRATAANTVEVMNYTQPVLPQAAGGTGYAVATRQLAQVVTSQTGAVATGTTQIPNDDTIPQNTEGDQYVTLAITPVNAGSLLEVEVIWEGSNSTPGSITVALFQDTNANALAAMQQNFAGGAGQPVNVVFKYSVVAGSTAATTFKVRAGANVAGTTTFNGVSGGRLLGGAMASRISIKEYLP